MGFSVVWKVFWRRRHLFRVTDTATLGATLLDFSKVFPAPQRSVISFPESSVSFCSSDSSAVLLKSGSTLTQPETFSWWLWITHIKTMLRSFGGGSDQLFSNVYTHTHRRISTHTLWSVLWGDLNSSVELWAGRPGFDFLQGQGYLLSLPCPDRLLEPPIQWVPRPLSPGIKRPGRGAVLTPPYIFLAWCIVKHRNKFTFRFLLWICFL